VCVVLIGNKCDAAESDVAVPETEARELAASVRVPLFLTSAKRNIHVTDVRYCPFFVPRRFHFLCSRLVRRRSWHLHEQRCNRPSASLCRV
jgi:hypothetical protein